MAKLVIVDDEPNVRYSLTKLLGNEDLQIETAATADEGLRLIQTSAPDAVLLDVRLPDMSGLQAFGLIRAIDPRLPVIVMTAFADTDTAIEATKQGAFDYLLKPIDLPTIRDVIHRAIETNRLRHVPAVYGEEGDDEGADRIVGRCAAMQEVYKAIGRVAAQDVTVLVVGESGTGKELVARAIFHHSNRAETPFLAINCATIPETLLESELFGHERGAFTGADRRRIGKFEQVNGGTLFLDEIGDMPIALQAKLLRILQDQQFERLGGNETIKTDVRLVAATNQSLDDLVAAGKFRQDLYYRLSGFMIRLPPLRTRIEDIPVLVEHFLRRYSRQMDRRALAVSDEVINILRAHNWPGNVRELQSTVKYAIVHSRGEVITAECLPDYLAKGTNASVEGSSPAIELDVRHYIRSLLQDGADNSYRKVCESVDRIVLDEVLNFVRGNQVQASELLGISRTTLRSKLRSLGLSGDSSFRAQPDTDAPSGALSEQQVDELKN